VCFCSPPNIDQLPDRTLTINDLRDWHRRWLGNVCTWAGEQRSVNMSEGGFAFAAAAQIPRLLDGWEQNCLRQWTPCHALDETGLVEAIAELRAHEILGRARHGGREYAYLASLRADKFGGTGPRSFCSSALTS
jgi:hypothetical protein